MVTRLDPIRRCFLYWYDKEGVPLYAKVCISSLVLLGGFKEIILCVDSPTSKLDKSTYKKMFPSTVRIVTPPEIFTPEMLITYNALYGKFEAINKADFFRICVLYLYGGFYCDVDVFALQSFQTLPVSDSYISSEDGTYLSNGVLFAVKGFPLFGYMIDHFLDRWLPDTFNLVGPPWFTEFQDVLNVSWDSKQHYLINWRDCKRIFSPPPIDVPSLVKDGVYSIHLWGSSIMRNHILLDEFFVRRNPDTMFSSLVKFLAEKGSTECKDLL